MKLRLTVTWTRLLGVALLGLAAAFSVGWSGLVSIAASSGHFAPVGWFLHWTMQNAVDTQSSFIERPPEIDLADPALVRRGAGHFATNCAVCHGAPGEAREAVALAMMPYPPRLEGEVGEWEDRELFWIVRHGIKYSGMPAWPTQERDEEVWAQVAFLRALPGMDEAAYAELAFAPEAEQPPGDLDPATQEALTDCARCHGYDGRGRGGDAFPVIAGQPEAYLAASLEAFMLGHRSSGFMKPPALRYDRAVLRELARHYSRQPYPAGIDAAAPPAAAAGEAVAEPLPGVPSLAVDPATAGGPPTSRAGLLDLGRRIAAGGLSERKIPACESCHGERGRQKNEHYPRLAGQPEWYLIEQLHLWKEKKRGGTPYAHIMEEFAVHLTEEHIQAVAAWYAEQRPVQPAGVPAVPAPAQP